MCTLLELTFLNLMPVCMTYGASQAQFQNSLNHPVDRFRYQVSWSLWAAITKCLRLAGLSTAGTDFSQLWRMASPRFGAHLAICMWDEGAIPISQPMLSTRPLAGDKGLEDGAGNQLSSCLWACMLSGKKSWTNLQVMPSQEGDKRA